MAADEDTELRDLVAQTLEANGVLGKIRAQLRSSVFLALEEQDSIQDKQLFVNRELKKFLDTKDGQLTAGLVREFLQYFNMEFTLAVFDPESGCEKPSRKTLAHDCGFTDSDKPNKGPLLLHLLKKPEPKKSEVIKENGDITKVSKDVSDKNLAKAKAKFQQYDLDHDGFIDREELNNVFGDLLPNFPRTMINAYIRDELKKDDKDMTGFNEFIRIYKQLHSLCRSVVSDEPVSNTTTSPQKSASGSGDSLLERKNKKNKSETSEKSKSEKSKVTSEKSKSNSRHTVNGEYDGSEPEDDPFFDDPLPIPDKSPLVKPKENTETASSSNAVTKELANDLKALDKKIADLGFDAGDDDYDDDFNTNSNFSASHKLSARSDQKSVGDEIDDSIEEDISAAGDEDDDGVDDTTDQTVSLHEVSGFDYVEDVSAALP